MADLEIKAFLGWLASDWHVTVTTHRLRKLFSLARFRQQCCCDRFHLWRRQAVGAQHMSPFGDIFYGTFGGNDAPPSDPNIGLAAQFNAAIGGRMQTLVAGAPIAVLAVMAGGLPTAARVLRERRRSRGRG